MCIFFFCGLICCFILQAVTGDDILSRGCRAIKLLEQSLSDIRSMVPTVLAVKVCVPNYFWFFYKKNEESLMRVLLVADNSNSSRS